MICVPACGVFRGIAARWYSINGVDGTPPEYNEGGTTGGDATGRVSIRFLMGFEYATGRFGPLVRSATGSAWLPNYRSGVN